LQADRLCEEAHNVSSDQCMWVSSELKRARSLVRIAEIQSTLHEQRCVHFCEHALEIANLLIIFVVITLAFLDGY